MKQIKEQQKEKDNDIKVNYCFTCEREFSTYSNLNRHLQSKKHKEKI